MDRLNLSRDFWYTLLGATVGMMITFAVFAYAIDRVYVLVPAIYVTRG